MGESRAGGHNTDEADPFARLLQTHRRLEEHLEDLVRATTTIAAGDRGRDLLAIVHDVVSYLSRGGARHVADEEQTLFPRLRDKRELDAILAQLEREHREHQTTETELRELAAQLGEGDSRTPELTRALADTAKKLASIYAAHIRAEESELFPQCRTLLDPAIIEEMGREMINRRPDRGKDQTTGEG